jgi:hypothetical protein
MRRGERNGSAAKGLRAPILHLGRRPGCIVCGEGGGMERLLPETPGGFPLALEAIGDAWSWRLSIPGGGSVAGLAPDPATARRSAVLAAFVASALRRTQQRRF